jgi:hypothetical protein
MVLMIKTWTIEDRKIIFADLYTVLGYGDWEDSVSDRIRRYSDLTIRGKGWVSSGVRSGGSYTCWPRQAPQASSIKR